jgi:hypothetical protein
LTIHLIVSRAAAMDLTDPPETEAITALTFDIDGRPRPSPKSYPPISSIPRTSASRLSLASPPSCSLEPVPASAFPAAAGDTVLYLAYGSNLAASVFLGRRGVRPVSRVVVSAPSLRLTFDLPGVPYAEPCFANTAIRKVPRDPPKLPPGLPDPPQWPPEVPVPNPPGSTTPGEKRPGKDDASKSWRKKDREDSRTNAHGDPEWPYGLIGVVYEVTREDYARIIATEGGGASYTDILVPCLALPAPKIGVPEDPPAPPEVPRPFLAHTLFAPRIPPPTHDLERGHACRGPKIPGWARRFLRPVSRPDPEYAQPSARYLGLLVDGAREHELPEEYQAWLQSLAPYERTSRRQSVGLLLIGILWAPLFLVVFSLSRLVADERGRIPLWLAVISGGIRTGIWSSYDGFFKRIFGDGERTERKKKHGDGEPKEDEAALLLHK